MIIYMAALKRSTLFITKSIISFAFIILQACGGASDADDTDEFSNNLVNLYLSSFEIIGYDIEFEREKTGVYELNVGSQVEDILVAITPENPEVEMRYSSKSDSELVENDISENGEFSVSLETGYNFLNIFIFDNEAEQFTTYSVEIYRIGESANIASYALFDFTQAGTPEITVEPEFSSNHFNYDATVAYSSCALSSIFKTEQANSITHIGSTEVNELEVNYQKFKRR